MKSVMNIVFSVLFILCLALPLATAEFGKNVTSDIDNAYLPELDGLTADNFDESLTEYLNKRIGFRSEALELYQKINAECFGVLEHPIYMYGKEGHVFFKEGALIKNYQHLNLDEEGMNRFADGLLEFQNYAQANGKYFLYFYIPDKETVYPEFYPDTVNVNGTLSRTQQLLNAMDARNINYLFAKDVMLKHKEIQPVNNRQYDAGHWNHNGAFVSLRELFNVLRKEYPQIEPLSIDDFNVDTVVEESLQVSHFEINEPVPVYSLKNDTSVNKKEEAFQDVIINYPNDYYAHYENPQCAQQPKLLIFGDSYLAGNDFFFTNSFSEYTYIHRYNVYNQEFFEYYVEQFDPDIIIYENPERSHVINLFKEQSLH